MNELHESWMQSEEDGLGYLGLSTVGIAAVETVQGTASGTTSVQIELGVTNVRDSQFPTTVAAAIVPAQLSIFNGQNAPLPVPNAEKLTTGAFTVANLNDTDGDGGGTTLDKDDTSVTDELDLMQVKIEGFQGLKGKCKLTVKSGQVKFWESSTKGTPIPLQGDALSIDLTGAALSRTLWCEATAASTAVRDIELSIGYEDEQGNLHDDLDKVKATAVWAELVSTKTQNSDSLWPGASAELRDFFNTELHKFGASYDTGLAATQYVIGIEFQIFPPDLDDENENNVTFDIARQHEGNMWSVSNGNVQEMPNEKNLWPEKDVSNDDGHDADEDSVADNGRLYSIDAPGFTYNASIQHAEAVLIFNYKEFVRVWFKTDDLKGNNSDGSRCSGKYEWNAQGWGIRVNGNTPGYPAYDPKPGKPNGVDTGNIPLDTPQP